jgi:glycosyltransferase involved in cell wall biosynthesis
VARSIVPNIVVVSEMRPGKGAALRAGFEAARGDFIVMLDADGSMDPAEIPEYVAALQNGYDLVKGSRFTAGGGSADISRLRQLGNLGLLGLVNLIYRSDFSDLCYGYIAFRRGCLPALELRSDGFEIETEIVVRAVLADLRIGEVPSFESARRYGESNLHTFRDGQRVLRTLLKERLRGRRRTRTERPTAETPAIDAVPLGPASGRARLGISAVTLGISALAPMATIIALRMLGVQ